jgi:hypothetical protein
MDYPELFQRPESFTLPLITAFLETNGTEALEWEPETIHFEIGEDFGVTPSQLIMDKLQAAITLLTTDQVYRYMEPFEEVVHVLNDDEADFTIIRPPTPEEIAWAMIESVLIAEPENPLSEVLSNEVKFYIGQVFHDAGLYRTGEFLPFVPSICGHDPPTEHPAQKDEIEALHEIKHQRIRIYVAHRYGELEAQIAKYFPGQKLTPLDQVLRLPYYS